MPSDDEDRRSRRGTTRPLTSEQAAAVRALGLKWRDEWRAEIAARENAGYPPFGRLASLVISAGDKPSAEGYARRLASTAPQADAVRVLGPAEAPLALVRGRYRFRLLVKSPRAFDLSAYLREWLAGAAKPKGDVRLEVDIDPMSFL